MAMAGLLHPFISSSSAVMANGSSAMAPSFFKGLSENHLDALSCNKRIYKTTFNVSTKKLCLVMQSIVLTQQKGSDGSSNLTGSMATIGSDAARLSPTIYKPVNPSDIGQLVPADPDFYRIGYVRHARAYGVEFLEGPNGFGVFAAKDIPYLQRPRMIMEIPMELMITVSKSRPWMFFPDFVPLGHPIFDIIQSTDPEEDWDMRLACLLLLAMDIKDNFWQFYTDFLADENDCSHLLLATEAELAELQDKRLAQEMMAHQKRAHDFWTKHWNENSPLKVKRLARTFTRFSWALSMVWSRNFNMTMTIGSLTQEANMLIPYVDMINHSFTPTCSYRWRRKDRILEVIINAGQSIARGTELTLNYLDKACDRKLLVTYGFSIPANPWNVVTFSGKAKIHLDSFLSAFSIAGIPEDYYYNDSAAYIHDDFVDGYVIAAARSLPSWSDRDKPFLPSEERDAVKVLKKECVDMLKSFPTTLERDLRLSSTSLKRKHQRWRTTFEHRLYRKQLIQKIMIALDLYLERLMF